MDVRKLVGKRVLGKTSSRGGVRPPAKVFAYWAQSVHGRVFAEMPGGMGLVWHPLYENEELMACERSLTLAMRQWDTWKAYALELQERLVKYEGGSPMHLNGPAA